jgi:DNA-binding SARP family transcriptional activator/Tfp pilus assembly protein PilF
VRIQVLGPIRAWQVGEELDLGSPGQRALFGLLALAGGQPVSRTELVDALWERRPPLGAANVIQTYVKHLRRLLEPARPARAPSALLPMVGGGYALRVPGEDVDLMSFRSLVNAASAAAPEQQRVAALLAQALGLWQGTPLADVPSMAGHPTVVALARERHAALGRYARAMIAIGAAAEALPLLAQAAAAQPLDEAAQTRLIRVYHAAGQRERAFAVYDATRRRLADELGIDPGPELAEAHAALLRDPVAVAADVTGARHSLTDTVAAQPVPAQLPADTPGFTGRGAELATLSGLLTPGPGHPGTTTGQNAEDAAVMIATVSGTAGVGKTALAVHWAHEARSRFPDGQLYADLRGYDTERPVPATGALAGFLSALGVPAQRLPADVDARAALFRSLLISRRMLVVLDNARDAEQVRPLLPASRTCRVVITSRSQTPSLIALEGARPLALGLLSVQEAGEMLARRLGRQRVRSAPEAVDEIIDHCARLPLALAIVAARAALHPNFPLDTIAAELREHGSRLDLLAGEGATTDVRRVFSWSYEVLRPPAARLFRLLGLHPGPDISARAAASLSGLPLSEARAHLSELTRAHLLEEHAPDRYAFHGLLRIYAVERERAKATDGRRRHDVERHEAVLRVLDHYLHTAYAASLLLTPARKPLEIPLAWPRTGVELDLPADYGQAYGWLLAEQEVLVAAVTWAADAGLDTQTWQLAWAVTNFLDRQGRWQDRLSVHTAALTAAQRLGDRAGQAHMRLGLANTYARMSRFEDAREGMEHALTLLTEIGDSAGQANVHLNLAFVERSLEDRPGALEHMEAALELYTIDGNLAGRARALHEIGWSHAQDGDYQLAYARCQQALELLQEAQDRYGEAGAWDSLGYIHHHSGEHRQAVTCYHRSLTLLDQINDLPHRAEVLVRIGDAHLATGDTPNTRESWNQALTILTYISHADATRVQAKLAALETPALDAL